MTIRNGMPLSGGLCQNHNPVRFVARCVVMGTFQSMARTAANAQGARK